MQVKHQEVHRAKHCENNINKFVLYISTSSYQCEVVQTVIGESGAIPAGNI